MQAKLYRRIYYPRFVFLIAGLVLVYLLMFIFQNISQ